MMTRPKGGGGDAREKLIEGMGRGFRVGGYGGIGVDGLATEAGLTSGAFYAHFGSKAEAFGVIVGEGLAFLKRGIKTFQDEHKADWLAPFVDFYLGDRMNVGLPDACALPTFSADVARAPEGTRALYTKEMADIAALVAGGLSGQNREARAWQILSILSGAAGMARAIDDDKTRDAILKAAKASAKAI